MSEIVNQQDEETVQDDPVGESMRRMLDNVRPQQSIVTALESIVRYAIGAGWKGRQIKEFLTSDEELGLILGDHMIFTIHHGINMGAGEGNRKMTRRDIERIEKLIRDFIPGMCNPMETLDTQVMGIAEEGWNPESLETFLCNDDFIDDITSILRDTVIPGIVDEIIQRLGDDENGLTDGLKNELRRWLNKFDTADPILTKLELVADELAARGIKSDAQLRHVLQFLRNDQQIREEWKRNFIEAIERGIDSAPKKQDTEIDPSKVHRAITQHLPRLRHGDTMYRLFAEKLPVAKDKRNKLKQYARGDSDQCLDLIVRYVTATVTRDVVLETVLKKRDEKPGKILRERDIKPLIIEDFFMRMDNLLSPKAVSYDDPRDAKIHTDKAFFGIAKDAIGERAARCRVDKEHVTEWIESAEFKTRFMSLMRDKIKGGVMAADSGGRTVDDGKTEVLTMAANAQLTLLTPEGDLTQHDIAGDLGKMLAQANGNIPAIINNVLGTEEEWKAAKAKIMQGEKVPAKLERFIQVCDSLLSAIRQTAERQVEDASSIQRGIRRKLRATVQVVHIGHNIELRITKPNGTKRGERTTCVTRVMDAMVDDTGEPDRATIDRLIEQLDIDHLRAEVYKRIAEIGADWFRRKTAKANGEGSSNGRKILVERTGRGRPTPPRDKSRPKTGGKAAGKVPKKRFREYEK